MVDRYLKEERQQLIMELLQSRKRVTVPELSDHFGISEVTIRRDLHDLAVSGKLQRAHRGAIEAAPAPPEAPVVQRMTLQQSAKERIASAAAQLIPNGASVFIGSGSTTTLLVREITERTHLTVTTNALNIAFELAPFDSEITVVLTGGVMRGSELSMLGHIAEQSLHEVRIDAIFMGAQALSIDGGWTTDHMPEVQTTRRIIETAKDLIVVADHTKLDTRAAAYIAPLNRVSTLVTDVDADPAFVKAAKELGVRVVLV